MLKIAGFIDNSVVDGPGIRNVVFFQGCPHNCYGCHNPDTHDKDKGVEMTVKKVVETLGKDCTKFDSPAITISGGDPFWQEDGLRKLCLALKGFFPKSDIWVYTGYLWEQVQYLTNILQYIDVLVDGPYIEKERTLELPFRGSSNQRLIDCAKSLGKKTPVLWEPEEPELTDSFQGKPVLSWIEDVKEGDIHYGSKERKSIGIR